MKYSSPAGSRTSTNPRKTQKQQQEPPAAKVAAYIFYAEITFPAVRTWKWVTGTA